jgi:hypothetical protein
MTEEDAARAYRKYLEDGIDPVKRRDASCASQFRGVSWDKHRNKWQAECKRKYLGLHTMEEDAAKAYNAEAARLGVALNVIPPAGAAGLGAGAGAGAGGGAAPKRAPPKTPAAHPTTKKTKRAAPTTLATPATNKRMKV